MVFLLLNVSHSEKKKPDVCLIVSSSYAFSDQVDQRTKLIINSQKETGSD